MKKLTIISLALTAFAANAQNVTIYLTNGKDVSYKADEVKYVEFTPGNDNPTQYESIDLGLSVKWATTNIGASSVTDYGDYFAWGEIAPKEEYNQGNCPTYGQKVTWDAEKNDAAYNLWGTEWRVPTGDEMQELIDNCTWEWTVVNTIPGYKVTSKVDGFTDKYIFLPASGCRVAKALNQLDVMGYYWTSTPSPANNNVSRNLSSNKDSHYLYWTNRFQGYPIRPVKAK